MIIPATYTPRIFANDLWDFTANWKDANGDTKLLSTWFGTIVFYVSKTDRTIVKTLDNTFFTLADTRPNIYVKINADNTGIGMSGFTSAPGYWIMHLAPDDTAENLVRLIEGKVKYEL